MCAITSPFYWFPRGNLPAALLLGPMIAGIIFSMRELLCNFPAPLFSPPRPFLAADCAKPHWFDSHHAGRQLADLLAILLVTLLSSAIVGWLLVAIAHCLEIPVPGVLLQAAQRNGRYGARLRRRYSPGGVYANLRVLFVAGAAVLVTRMMLGITLKRLTSKSSGSRQ